MAPGRHLEGGEERGERGEERAERREGRGERREERGESREERGERSLNVYSVPLSDSLDSISTPQLSQYITFYSLVSVFFIQEPDCNYHSPVIFICLILVCIVRSWSVLNNR